MSSVLDLARPELRRLRPYTAGAYEPDCIRLNANESPWRLPGDKSERGLNIYPPPRPFDLRAALARYYAASEEELLVTRGSSEAIDVLIRGFCRAGEDGILICPPTFDMYRLYAGIQGAEVVTVPLSERDDFALDADRVVRAAGEHTKIVFICSPNNPTGGSIPRPRIEAICDALAGRALVVIDEAYHEFANAESCLHLRESYEHVVLLRTLSKCVALAGARCGALIAAPEVIEFLGGVLPPYTFPTPSTELVLSALVEDSLRVSDERIALIKRERQRLAAAFLDLPAVTKVYPSDANFLLVRTRDAQAFAEAARQADILIRLFPAEPALADCVRITVGRPRDNDRLLQAVAGVEWIDES
ncbi:histidinol-phosphate transaminase [Candidatus Rariloculus sp.]|uniref:histidinol-phosphate transaminase n=1 Tax=Candidatus Rariloculus sp. TaxID=3101265 RepID=UPI003D1325B0